MSTKSQMTMQFGQNDDGDGDDDGEEEEDGDDDELVDKVGSRQFSHTNQCKASLFLEAKAVRPC